MNENKLDDFEIAPIEQADTIPADWYTSSQFESHDRHIIRSGWQLVGHESQLSEAGSFLTASLSGEPIISVRQKDGKICSFYNVCRHRGGPLAMERCGHANMLQCKYHGWTYKLDGSLRGVPKFDRTELFDKKDYGLTPVSTVVWQGLIFVCLSPQPPPLDKNLKGISEQIKPIEIGRMVHGRRAVYDIACNWKVYVDNFLEGYHVPLVHPELCDMIDMKGYVTETSSHYSVQYSPLKTAGYSDDPATGDESVFYYFIFPNIMLNVLPGRVQTNVVEHISRDHCKVLFDYY